MIQRTRWRPDTCGCDLVYAWDDALPAAQRVHLGVAAVPCAMHAGLVDPATIHQAVMGENVAKNVAVQAAAASQGYLPPVYDTFGNVVTPEVNPQFSPSLFGWSFDAQRKVTVTAPVVVGVSPASL